MWFSRIDEKLQGLMPPSWGQNWKADLKRDVFDLCLRSSNRLDSSRQARGLQFAPSREEGSSQQKYYCSGPRGGQLKSLRGVPETLNPALAHTPPLPKLVRGWRAEKALLCCPSTLPFPGLGRCSVASLGKQAWLDDRLRRWFHSRGG